MPWSRLTLVATLAGALAACSDSGNVVVPGVDMRPDIFIFDLVVKPPDGGPPDAPGDLTSDGQPQPDTNGLLSAPFSFDFEQNNGGISATGDWEWGQLGTFKFGTDCSTSATPPPSAHSGTRLWGTVLDDCYTPIGNNADACNNANVGDDSVLSLTFVLPSPLLNPKLEWWEWNDYFLDFDWTEVRINNTVVYQDCTGSHSKPTAWRNRIVAPSLTRSHGGVPRGVAWRSQTAS